MGVFVASQIRSPFLRNYINCGCGTMAAIVADTRVRTFAPFVQAKVE
jgi:hypothetical protein